MSKEKKKIRIKQVRSGIAFPRAQKLVLWGLGFRRLQQVVERPDTPAIHGMVHKVRHLVEVLEAVAVVPASGKGKAKS